MRTIFALLLMCSAAVAQTVTSTTAVSPFSVSTCCTDGKCWNEIGGVCHGDPAERQILLLEGDGRVTNLTSNITNSPTPRCEEGWTLVADSAMQPKCAKELKDPIER